MPCLAKMAEKMRMDYEQIFGITKLKMQAFSGNDSRGHCSESQLDDGEDDHPDRHIINIWVNLRRELRSLRSDTLFVTQNNIFVNQMNKNFLFYGIYGNN